MNIKDIMSGGGVGSLPLSFMVGGAFAGAGAILGAAYFIFGGNKMAMGIVAGGILLVALLLFLYRAILKMLDKRKASPLSQGIAGNAAAAPQGISEPARRARLDDLRRNFDQGVEKFRAAGKDLYSVPWYVLVGEPGSGKTEAIRHCNVGFPPGLQDQLQGAGGTLNMNWWFTNQAIILDTAGRLMFEEIVPGSSNEWMEFLKLLKNNRPNCPINGMLLVIPVDTLIKDTADQLEKKCTKIAQQFDQIQRTLGVRFPVFVIISKCDLLNGFREFFENLSDPQLQHQIMGWSNPASLDERFDPATVVNHLETVKTRLVERRQSLLLDPINTEDAQARRVDQVDALYALPDSITKIAPRLKRYLEMIFVAGEWSPKPLFLRGIYFTSSMTEGAALDAELAEVLGVPVDSLPEGRVFRRDRAYFLRDLFIEKVFREKGLVTRATNADKQQRARRSIVMTVSFAAVIFLFAMTWFGAAGLEKTSAASRNFWKDLSQDDRLPTIIEQKGAGADTAYSYNMAKFHNLPLGDFFAKNLPPVQAPIQIPAVFKPITALTGNAVNTQRREEYRNLFESMVLAPLYNAARQKIISATPADWSPQYTQALAQLMKLEYAADTGKPPAGADEPHPQVDLDPLFAIVLSPDDYKNFKGQADGLQQVADWLYTPAAAGDAEWPPKKAPFSLDPGSDVARSAITAGITDSIQYWNKQTSDNSPQLASISDVRKALLTFRTAESGLQSQQQNLGKITTLTGYTDFQTQWKPQMVALYSARDAASQAWAIASKSKGDSASIVDLYKSQKQVANANAQAAFDMLLRYTIDAPASTDTSSLNASSSLLAASRSALSAAEKGLKDGSSDPDSAKTLQDLTDFDNRYLASITGIDNAQHHRFEAVAHLYEIADKMLTAKGAADATIAPAASLDDAFTKIDKDYADAAQSAGRLALKSTGPDDPLNKAIALTQFMLDASARAKKDLLADSILSALPTDPQRWPAAIAALSKSTPPDNLQRPQVPLVTFPSGQEKTFDAQFAPDAAGVVSDRLATLAKLTGAQDASGKILDASDLASRAAAAQKGFAAYRDQYLAYWRDTVKDQLQFNYPKFADFANKLGDSSEAGINGELRSYGDRIAYALNRVGDTDDANPVKLAPAADREECKEDLANWLNLGNDPKQVRRTPSSRWRPPTSARITPSPPPNPMKPTSASTGVACPSPSSGPSPATAALKSRPASPSSSITSISPSPHPAIKKTTSPSIRSSPPVPHSSASAVPRKPPPPPPAHPPWPRPPSPSATAVPPAPATWTPSSKSSAEPPSTPTTAAISTSSMFSSPASPPMPNPSPSSSPSPRTNLNPSITPSPAPSPT